MIYDPIANGAKCNQCPLRGDTVTPPQTCENPKGIVILEGPGSYEIAASPRGPLKGPSGKIFDNLCHVVGIKRSDLWITNRMLCLPKTKTPTELRSASLCCSDRLKRELDLLGKTLPILAMGKYAVSYWDDKTNLDQLRGYLLSDMVLATIHPARTMPYRDPWMRKPLLADIRKFKRLMDGERPTPPALFVNDLSIVEKIWADCDGIHPIAVDIETDGKDIYNAIPTLIALASTKMAVSFNFPPPPEVRGLLKGPCRKVLQNGFWFDAPILRRVDIPLGGKLEDIRDFRRALSSDSPLSLNYMASIYLICRRWKKEGYTKDPLGNAEDALRTAQLYEIMEREAQNG